MEKRPNGWSMKDGKALKYQPHLLSPQSSNARLLRYLHRAVRNSSFSFNLINLQRLLPPRMGSHPEKEGYPPLQDFLGSHG